MLVIEDEFPSLKFKDYEPLFYNYPKQALLIENIRYKCSQKKSTTWTF